VAVALAIAVAAARKSLADDFVIPLELPQVNFIGLGVGAYPDFFGSEDSRVGAAPNGRLSPGGARFVRLMVNESVAPVLLDSRLRFCRLEPICDQPLRARCRPSQGIDCGQFIQPVALPDGQVMKSDPRFERIEAEGREL
jgi:hypothetical protein